MIKIVPSVPHTSITAIRTFIRMSKKWVIWAHTSTNYFFRELIVERGHMEAVQNPNYLWIESKTLYHRHLRNCFHAWTSSWMERAEGKVDELMIAHSR